MPDLMSSLHPALAPGPFDVLALLQHEPPEDWRPTVGDVVYGVVTSIEVARRDDYTFPVIYMITKRRTLVRVRCSAVMLRKQITEQRIQVGSVMSVRFDGAKTSQAGREYKTFTVRSL